MQMLEPEEKDKENISLGGLGDLPSLRPLLIHKHSTEAERVMRLTRALVHQMRGQVSQVEAILADAWHLHRSEALRVHSPITKGGHGHKRGGDGWSRVEVGVRGVFEGENSLLPSHDETTSQAKGFLKQTILQAEEEGTLPIPPVTSTPQSDFKRGKRNLVCTPGTGGTTAFLWPTPNHTRNCRDSCPWTREDLCRQGVPQETYLSQWKQAVGSGDGAGTRQDGSGGKTPTPSEHLRWLCDLAAMMGHEQWRKEEMLAGINFGQNIEAIAMRNHVLAHWSSKSVRSFLDRVYLDELLVSAQVPKLPST
ncbi:unnamed protein product [Choristocarpus tenellus]